MALEFDVEFQCRTEGALAVRATFGGSVQQKHQQQWLRPLRRSSLAKAAAAANKRRLADGTANREYRRRLPLSVPHIVLHLCNAVCGTDREVLCDTVPQRQRRAATAATAALAAGLFAEAA